MNPFPVATALCRRVLSVFLVVSASPLFAQYQLPGDAELQKISRGEIIATVKHLRELAKDQQAIIEDQKRHLTDAAIAQTNALKAQTQSLTELTDLQRKIDSLAAHDKSVTDKLNAAMKSLWWYRLHWWGAWIMLGIGVLLCIVLAVAKFAGRFVL